jgi:hypothetical protein
MTGSLTVHNVPEVYIAVLSTKRPKMVLGAA